MSSGLFKKYSLNVQLTHEEIDPEKLIDKIGIYVSPFTFGTDEADRIVGGFEPNSIYARGGNDEIDAGNGRNFVDGGAGDDQILGGDDTDTLIGGAGGDTILGGDGEDTIHGDFVGGQAPGYGNDTLHGGRGNDQMFGGGGNDYITGGEDEDIIQGGAGDDMLWGEGPNSVEQPPIPRSADTFVFSENVWGHDTIFDFDDGLDLIDFSQHQGISGMGDFTVSQIGADTVITYDYSNPLSGNFTSTIKLVGISAGDVGQDDFVF